MPVTREEIREHLESRITGALETGNGWNVVGFSRQANIVGCDSRGGSRFDIDSLRQRGLLFSREQAGPYRVFSPGTVEKLAEFGSVYRLSRQSLIGMNDRGSLVVSQEENLLKFYADSYLMKLRARGTDVVLPRDLIIPQFLPDLDEQKMRLSELEAQIKHNLDIDDIRVIMGEAVDYADLLRQINQFPSQSLVGGLEDIWVSTSTMVVCGMTQKVGQVHVRLSASGREVQVNSGSVSGNSSNLGMIPLIVPSIPDPTKRLIA